MIDDTTTAHPTCEQTKWLHDYARWRSEHRQALTWSTKIQARILEHEAALESQIAEINGFEEFLRPDEFDCINRPCADTRSAEQRIDDQRAFHRQTTLRYVDILSRVEELAEFSAVAVWRSLE